MSDNNRTCKVCGKKYYFCPTCGKAAPSWRKVYDEEECKNVYKALSDYYYKHISAEEANKYIEACISPIANEDLLEIVKSVKSELNANASKNKIKLDIVNESMK